MLVENEVEVKRSSKQFLEEVDRLLNVRLTAPAPVLPEALYQGQEDCLTLRPAHASAPCFGVMTSVRFSASHFSAASRCLEAIKT